MIPRFALLLADSIQLQKPGAPAAPPAGPTTVSWTSFVSDPRNSVLIVLVLALLLGGGRKLLQGWRARQAADRLGDPDASPEQIEAAAEHGRAALVELFGLLDPKVDRPRRLAAGRALARLWADDQLIVEEEKALVTRGFEVAWRARRRYPRALREPIPVEVAFGLPFLDEEGPGVRPSNLEWSVRVAGSERAKLETFSPWTTAASPLRFHLEPADFATNGPHRLSFEAKVRTAGLTSPFELALPHVPFTFEFDPNLTVESLLTLPDDARAGAFARAVRLEPVELADPRFVQIGPDLALRNPPDLVVAEPPCDLAHRLALEFEGLDERVPAGSVVVATDRLDGLARFPIGLGPEPIRALLERPGEYRVRAVLTADPHLGWADPDVRSLWPGEVVTPWTTVRAVRL